MMTITYMQGTCLNASEIVAEIHVRILTKAIMTRCPLPDAELLHFGNFRDVHILLIRWTYIRDDRLPNWPKDQLSSRIAHNQLKPEITDANLTLCG